MKKLTFRSMLDNLRSSVAGVADAVTGANKFDVDPDENVKAQDFAFSEVSRSGFPHDPTCLAFEPVQRILAIGTRQGSIRLIGRPGVDFHLRPPSSSVNGISTEQAASDREALFGGGGGTSSAASSTANAVLQILFLINEGTFVSVTGNSRLHLWSYKTKKPEIVQTLEFQKEALTVCYLPYGSKWMYVGTEKGNVHVVQVETFSLSGYVINWNKAMELSSRNHPGKVIHLSVCPLDSAKLLIGFDSGLITLWDLKTKTADQRFQATDNLSYVSWHFDGKQFVSSHSDASLAVWNVRVPGKPTSVSTPHVRRSKDDPIIPILQVEWKKHKSGNEPLLLFSGGVSFDQKATPGKISKTQTMTIIQGKSTTVLEMEHPIVEFLCIPAQPWNPDGCDYEAVIVLLENDLVAIDLVSPGYPLYENPYPMDLHEPPVINCQYVADCPSDIIPTLYTAGAKHKKTNFTDKEWPIDGGQWGTAATGYSDFLLTSHTEGTIRFWDVSSATLQHLDRIKIAKIFERPKKQVAPAPDLPTGGAKPEVPLAPVKISSSVLDGPFDIQCVTLDPECRYLAVACVGGLVILYLWNKQETSSEISVLDIPIRGNSSDPLVDGPSGRTPPNSAGPHRNSLDKMENGACNTRRARVKAGLHKRAAGYQPFLVCNTDVRSPAAEEDCTSKSAPSLITSLALSPKYGLVAIGTELGLIVVDFIQKHCVINIATPDLYGSDDPYNRGARSPKSEKPPSNAANTQNNLEAVGGQTNNSASPAAPASPRHHGSSAGGTTTSSAEKNELSRSRSSSSSSLDLIASEAILCLKFADTYGKRADSAVSACLWIGTELGSVLVFSFIIPLSSSVDPSSQSQQTTQRLSQPVIGTPTGTLFRYNNSGGVLAIDFLDARGTVLSESSIVVPISSSSAREDSPARAPRLSDATALGASAIPPLVNLLADPRHILVVCMERQIRTFILPSQGLYQKYKLHQDPSLSVNAGLAFLKASIQTSKENACIYCYLSTGRVVIYSLPSLRPLLEVGISGPNDLRVAKTVSFGRHGGAVYLVSKSELQKVTFSAETTANFSQMNGELYTVGREVIDTAHRHSVSAPAVGFLKGLMGASTGPTLTPAQQLDKDREELFGEAAGKASKSTARHVPGSNSAMENAKMSSSMANSEIGRAKMLAIERGEKLSEIEETTERMRMQAEAFSSNASQLANKYKDKKWYKL
ncbi:Syntaxin-binding protein 5 [Hypsibius exemplaris]|uniref:Syntaxin-binding protein 5 n=1 Tax=Hypsibius exemplaris TaxID=2072580 RepID=A0A1W0WT25_HYPEX|nr:Syntaxin-binding protein 5 [Hypsibius exemplaris]